MSTKSFGVASETEFVHNTRPRFSARYTRPPGANATAVGDVRPLHTIESVNGLGTLAATADPSEIAASPVTATVTLTNPTSARRARTPRAKRIVVPPALQSPIRGSDASARQRHV